MVWHEEIEHYSSIMICPRNTWKQQNTHNTGIWSIFRKWPKWLPTQPAVRNGTRSLFCIESDQCESESDAFPKWESESNYLRSLFQSPRQSFAQSRVTGFQSGEAVSKIHSDRYTCEKCLDYILSSTELSLNWKDKPTILKTHSQWLWLKIQWKV